MLIIFAVAVNPVRSGGLYIEEGWVVRVEEGWHVLGSFHAGAACVGEGAWFWDTLLLSDLRLLKRDRTCSI
jgi:hypothetical protein